MTAPARSASLISASTWGLRLSTMWPTETAPSLVIVGLPCASLARRHRPQHFLNFLPLPHAEARLLTDLAHRQWRDSGRAHAEARGRHLGLGGHIARFVVVRLRVGQRVTVAPHGLGLHFPADEGQLIRQFLEHVPRVAQTRDGGARSRISTDRASSLVSSGAP